MTSITQALKPSLFPLTIVFAGGLVAILLTEGFYGIAILAASLPLAFRLFTIRRYFFILILTAANLNAVKIPEPFNNLDILVTVGTIILVSFYLLAKRLAIPTVILLPTAFFLLATGIGCITSPVPMDSLMAWIRHLSYVFLMALAMVATTDEPKVLHQVSWAFMVASIAPSVMGLYQAFTGNGVIIIESSVKDIGLDFTRAFGFMSHPNFLALFLMQTIIIGTVYLREQRQLSISSKAVIASILILNFACMFYTYSRGPLLGLLAALSFYMIMRKDRLLLLVVPLAVAVPLLIPSVGARLLEVSSLERLLTESSFSWRLEQWHVLLNYFSTQPLFGSGLKSSVFFTAGAPHNEYLAFLVETGIFGLFALLVLLGTIWRIAIGSVKQPSHDIRSVLPVAFVCILLAFTLTAFADNVFSVPSSYCYFWMLLGSILAAKTRTSELVHDNPEAHTT